MRIKTLSLKNFRNYLDLNIEFNDKLNIIIGNNAQGKTNILEAIYFLSITKSFLGIHDKALIYRNMDYTKVSGNIVVDNFNKNLSILLNKDCKKIEINNKLINKHIDYIGNLRVIIFSPDDIRLLKDSPSNRRRFLNIEISQLYDKYVKLLSEFNIILKQRNEYLKVCSRTGNINDDYFNIIDNKYVELAVSIYRYRYNFINKLNQFIENKFYLISGDNGLVLKYECDIDIDNVDIMKNSLFIKLKDGRNRDISYGSTNIGPHRDNFSFYLNENNLLMYGSQGQLKMAILALKLAEIDVFKSISMKNPILLLDDIFSELDIEKRNNLINLINNCGQTIMTTTDLSEIHADLISIANIYKIENGKIVEKIDNN